MNDFVTIAVPEPWDRVPVGEAVPLRFAVALAADAPFAITIPAGGVRHPTAHLTTDLMLRDVTLSPGDAACVTLGARFDAPGPQDLRDFGVQVDPVGRPAHERALVNFAPHPFRAVPSLAAALTFDVSRVCAYGDAVKVEAVVTNVSAAALTEVELRFGPADAVRAGPLVRREARLAAGGALTFDLVVAGGEVEFAAAATVAGERVESRRVRRVPGEEAGESAAPAQFGFLEPRALTTDRVTLTPEGGGPGPTLAGGVFPVRGGKSRYVLTVHPSHPQASGVRLYAAAGQVEVEAHAKSGRQWPFLVTVVENPMFTQLVRLDYDVQVPGGPLRGEFYLSIRPTGLRRWGFAATAGLAITLKGAAAVGPLLLRRDGGTDFVLENLHELLERRWLDAGQALSIPIIWAGLWLADRGWRSVQEG